MPKKKRNSFRHGDLLKVKQSMSATYQVGGKWKTTGYVDPGKIVIFLSAKLCTEEHWETTPQGDMVRRYSIYLRFIDEGIVKRVRCNFDDVYRNFKLVQKA